MGHWNYSDLNKTFAKNSYITVVERRGDIFKDGLDIHLWRNLSRGRRCYHRTHLRAFLEVSDYLVVVIDSYLSNLNWPLEASLLTVLTQRRRFLWDNPSVRFQVELLQLIVEVKEVSIDLVNFDHGFAGVRQAWVVRLRPIATLEAWRPQSCSCRGYCSWLNLHYKLYTTI